MSSRSGPRPSSTSSFNVFFEGWLARQQALLDELIHISSTHKSSVVHEEDGDNNDGDRGDQLIEKVLSHYGEYYQEKAEVMKDDIFLVFCPPWLTSLERAFLWAAGFKPSLAFRLLEVSDFHMESEQIRMLKELKSDTMREDKEVAEALATVQEKVGSPQLMNLARQVGTLVDGQVSDFNEAMKDVKEAMTRVVERADNLRRSTVLKVVGILNWEQKIKFLITVAKFQLGVRTWGLQKDNQREQTPSSTA